MNVTLIGMPGVGKSVIGKELAGKLGYAFFDADAVIEARSGMRLQQLIDTRGEEVFLGMEERVILDLGDVDNHVICPGGSIVYSETAMTCLCRNSTVVFLDAPLSVIRNRINNQSTRGIIGVRAKNLETIYNERSPLYGKYAELVVPVPDPLDVRQAVAAIIRMLPRN